MRKQRISEMYKTIIVAAAAAAALLSAAVPANAAVVNLNIGAASIDQDVMQETNQGAASIALAIGTVHDGSDVSSDAINGVNLASMDMSVDQTTGGFLNGNLLLGSVDQTLNDVTNQGAFSLAGSGSVYNGSSLSSLAANIANQASVTINVTQ